jgi:L-aspartate oxidase
MLRYHAMLDLAPRDVVSRAIVEEQMKGQVYIDIRHRGEEYLLKRFPGISKECLKRGIDITKDLISVTPAAHYLCGGIKTNEYGETNILGLLAFGECSNTGVHGANRLASNSLLECLSFTAISARKQNKISPEITVQSQNRDTKSAKVFIEIRHELQETMWKNVGIIRNTESIGQALKQVQRLKEKLDSYKSKLNKDALETKNMVDVAYLITMAILNRKESRGTHKVDEYPHNNDENWLKHIVFTGNEFEIRKLD